jgi:hypothetical protein
MGSSLSTPFMMLSLLELIFMPKIHRIYIRFTLESKLTIDAPDALPMTVNTLGHRCT